MSPDPRQDEGLPDVETLIALVARYRQGIFDVTREGTRVSVAAARRSDAQLRVITLLEERIAELAADRERLMIRAEIDRVALEIARSDRPAPSPR